MPRTAQVTPNCCKAVREAGTVFLLYSLDQLRDRSYLKEAPQWAAYHLNLETGRARP